MADAVTTQKLYDKGNEVAFKFTNISDGTGESNVLKVDASALKGAANNGTERLIIENVDWNISNFNNESVQLIWDGTTDVVSMILTNSGSWKLWQTDIPNNSDTPNGDLLLTTKNFNANSSYTIILKLKKSSGYDFYA